MKKKSSKTVFRKIIFLFAGFLCMSLSLPAQTNGGSAKEHVMTGWLFSSGFYLVVSLAVILLLVVVGLSRMTVNLSKAFASAKKKLPLIALLILSGWSAPAQTTAPVTPERPVVLLPDWIMDANIYFLSFFAVIIISAIAVLYQVNMKLIRLLSPQAVSEKVAEAAVLETKPTLLRRIYLRLVDSTPVEKEIDVLLDHDYDGIKELDNNLPPWWKYGFYLTIIFAFVYLINYHVTRTGKLQAEEYKTELLVAQQEKEERMKANAEYVTEENVALLSDAARLAEGKETFTKLCSACHRNDAGGQVGPNLTDEYWLHGGGIKNVFKTITYGVPNKGMLSWQSQLSPRQIQQVASYVLSLSGSNPPSPKEAQGEKWVEVPSPDSTTAAKHDTLIAALADTLKKN